MDQKPKIPEVILKKDEAHKAQNFVRSLVEEFSQADCGRYLQTAHTLASQIPHRVLEELLAMRHQEAVAAVVIRGYPVDEVSIGRTPPDWRLLDNDSSVEQEFWLTLLACQLGDPFSWSTLQGGRLLLDVFPIQGQDTEQTGHSSNVCLDIHVEDAFSEFRCDYLALLALRNQSHTATTLASIDLVDLPDRYIDVLFQPNFVISPDTEHLRNTGGLSMRDIVEPTTVAALFGDPSSPYIRIDPPYMKLLEDNPLAEKALIELVDQLYKGLIDVKLAPGDILILDNFRTVHGRRPFCAHYDGTDRWLKKLMVTRDLRKSRSNRNGVCSWVIQS